MSYRFNPFTGRLDYHRSQRFDQDFSNTTEVTCTHNFYKTVLLDVFKVIANEEINAAYNTFSFNEVGPSVSLIPAAHQRLPHSDYTITNNEDLTEVTIKLGVRFLNGTVTILA